MGISPSSVTVPETLWSSSRVPTLIRAIYVGEENRVQMLLGTTPNVLIDIRDNLKRTPLHMAVFSDTPSILHLLLLKNIINIEARDSEDCTALHRAIERGSLSLVRVLLYHGADANAPCGKFSGQTPFIMSIQNNSDDISLELLHLVIDFNETDDSGNSALYFAIQNDSELLDEIIKRRKNLPVHHNEILESLHYKNCALFEYCRRRVDYNWIIIRMFSILLSQTCKFKNKEWLNTMNHILTYCDYSEGRILTENNTLCEKCCIFQRDCLFRKLLETLSRRNIDRQHRYQLVYTFLSYGTHFESLETYSFHTYYTLADKPEMLHVLVQAGFKVDNYLHRINSNTNPHTVRLYLTYTKLSPNYILQKMLLAKNSNMSEAQLCVIQYLSTLCTPNNKTKALYEMFCEEFDQQPFKMKKQTVPKLLELSRDQVRQIYGEKFKTSCTCCIINCINIPQVVKDLLLLERSLT